MKNLTKNEINAIGGGKTKMTVVTTISWIDVINNKEELVARMGCLQNTSEAECDKVFEAFSTRFGIDENRNITMGNYTMKLRSGPYSGVSPINQ